MKPERGCSRRQRRILHVNGYARRCRRITERWRCTDASAALDDGENFGNTDGGTSRGVVDKEYLESSAVVREFEFSAVAPVLQYCVVLGRVCRFRM